MNELMQFDVTPLMTEQELHRCEQTIDAGMQTYIEVGEALRDIRDKRGYRFHHGTFADYVESRWKMSISSAYNQIAAAQVAENVQPVGQIGYTQAVALSRLEPEQQREFAATHDINDMTKRQIEEAVRAQKKAERERDEAIEQAESIMERDRQLRLNFDSKVQSELEQRLQPEKEALKTQLEREAEQKFKDDIRSLRSANERLSEKAAKLDELEQADVWAVARARNEITRIMNDVYAHANKGFAEIETQYLDRLSPDMNTVPVLDHIADQLIGMGERIKSWLEPKRAQNLVIEGEYSEIV